MIYRRTLRIASLLLLTLCLSLTGCGPLTFAVGVSPYDQQLTTTSVITDGKLGSDRVAIIDVTGPIFNAQKPGLLEPGENPVSRFHEQLAIAASDPKVKAVVLRLNTPGGTVTASDAMYRDLRRFREATGKPVVAVMMDLTTSGGYYVACGADHIVAYPTSVTGSIGVIVQTFSVKPALNRLGIQTDAIKSGPNKDAGSPFSDMTPEHRAILQELVDDFYQRFVELVRTRRPDIPQNRFAELIDGRVLSGEQAVAVGLADETGDLYEAFAAAMQLADIASADLVRYHRPMQYVGSPYATGPSQPVTTQVNFMQLNMTSLPGLDAPAGFYYLWQPAEP